MTMLSAFNSCWIQTSYHYIPEILKRLTQADVHENRPTIIHRILKAKHRGSLIESQIAYLFLN